MQRFFIVLIGLCAYSLPSSAFADPLEDRLAAGAEAFQAGDFERALVEFEAAADIEDLPVVRFNIARANEELSNCSVAREQYEKLAALDALDAEIAGAVAKRLDQIDTCHQKWSAAPSTASTSPRVSPPVESIEPVEELRVTSPAPRRSRTPAIAGWATLGIGTGTFVAMLVEHSANTRRIRDGYATFAGAYGCTYSRAGGFVGETCDESAVRSDVGLAEWEQHVKRVRTRGAAVFVVSGAAIAVGAGLLVYSRTRRRGAVTIAPWLGPSAAGAVASTQF